MNKKFFVETGIILCITILLLGLMEAGCRFIFRHKVREPLYRFDQELLYMLRPNLNIIGSGSEPDSDDDYSNVRFTTNADAFRGGPLLDAPEKRVIVYGDSNVMGRWLNTEDLFPSRLEKYLQDALSKEVEVLNAGVVGYGPDQSLLRFEKEADVYKPDAVIFVVFADNDYGDLVRNKLFKLDAQGELVSTSYPVVPDQVFQEQKGLLLVKQLKWKMSGRKAHQKESMVSTSLTDSLQGPKTKTVTFIQDQIAYRQNEFVSFKYSPKRDASIFFDTYDMDLAIFPGSESAQAKIMLMRKVLQRAAQFAASKRIQFLVMVLPSRIDLTTGEPSTSYKDLARFPDYAQRNLTGPVEEGLAQDKVPFISLFEAYSRNNPEEMYYRGTDNGHWNEQGQDAAARAAAEWIISNGFLD